MIPKGAKKWLDENIGHFDILHLAGNWSPINVLAYKAARKHNVPYVFSAMGLLDIIGRSRLFKHIFRLLWTRPILHAANAVVAISPREYDNFIRFGVPKKKVYFIPNGITMNGLDKKDDAAFRNLYGLDARKIILFIGRLNPVKGVDLLVAAFSKIAGEFTNYQLLIFGNDYGGFQAKLERMIEALHLKHCVKIFPPIFGIEKSWAYHAAEIFVIPSRYDTMTIIALEAAATACPLLITNQCDFAAIGDNGGALVVSPEARSIAHGLHDLLNDPVMLKQRGILGQKFVLKNYHWEKISNDFIRMFQDVLDSMQA